MLDEEEANMIVRAVRLLISSAWPLAAAAEPAKNPDMLLQVFNALAEQGFIPADANSDASLEVAGIVAEQTGRAACPTPVIPLFVVNLALGSAIPVQVGPTAVSLAPGGARVADGKISGEAKLVENIAIAEQIIVRVESGLALLLVRDTGLEERPGLTVPPLVDVTFDKAPAEIFEISDSIIEDAALIERLLLAARARGAAARAFDLVLDHVQQRSQFGQPLARFQSMQHKLADCSLALEASGLLIADACVRFDSKDCWWRFLANAAIAYAAAGLRKVSLEIHHAFGAIGYSEEHEAPRLFRRVHADLGRLGGQTKARAEIARQMLHQERSMPKRHLGSDIDAFRGEFRNWLEKNWDDTDRENARARPFHERNRDKAFAGKLGADGWLSQSWPKEVGGAGLSPLKQLTMVEELVLAAAPTTSVVASCWLIGPEIIRHGSPELKEALSSGIRSGKYAFALGYSEPEAGSDLTALKTSARRDGDYYIVNGQKLWGTGAEHATHIVLAVRTDPEAKPRSSGISILIVPTDLSGITIQPGMALYGHTFCSQFYDNVRVPASYLLGKENKGWAILTSALAAERIQMGGSIVEVQNTYENLCRHIASHPALYESDLICDLIGQFGAEIEAARQLSLRSVRALEEGRLPVVEGAYTKVFSGDLMERFAEAALDILGDEGLLSEDAPNAPFDGKIEQMLRKSIMMVIGGGAAEIQKTIIAQRGLGLPR